MTRLKDITSNDRQVYKMAMRKKAANPEYKPTPAEDAVNKKVAELGDSDKNQFKKEISPPSLRYGPRPPHP